MPNETRDPGQSDSRQQGYDRPIPVVGIGASAGGIKALQAFLPAVTAPCGIAFVVVQHLDPERGSMLPEILARVSSLPVTGVESDTPIEPDHVYVIPPNATLTIVDSRLRLGKPVEPRGFRTPIDSFFMSLAEAKGRYGACVILSGTGSDGTVGLRAVKEHGGLAIAQQEAEYDGMMRSAVGTGMVDYVMPADAIPKQLSDHFRHLNNLEAKGGLLNVRPDALGQIAQVCALLRARTGHDFSDYKDKTVARRMQRRMQVLQIEDVSEFIERLRRDPPELDALLQDLLIGVTSFFRDPAAYAELEKRVIPRLFDGKGPDDTVRAWVPGCSTGEEAYSIAMLLREHARTLRIPPKLQIFASDIDDRALQAARTGRYPVATTKGMPTGLLARYLVREDGTYRIAGELREICLFSSHNVLRDAPFSRQDLISCRNLLIYLNAGLQNRLIPLFHYALNEAGYLFLGSSENVARHSRLFATVDKTNRVFQRRAQDTRRLPEFPLTTAPDGPRAGHRPPPRGGPQRVSPQAMAERQLVDRFAPAYVVVNAEGEMLHASGRTGKYLELAPGVPRMEIFAMARRGLRLDLRAALHKAVGSGQAAVQRGVVVDTNGGRQTIDLTVQPLRPGDSQDRLYMVVFQDVGGITAEVDAPATEAEDDVENATLRQLEAELRSTKERLQTATEELESSNEELKSSNEELSSINEELQSANEELETSKEELQSMNEELQTVNAELSARVEDLGRANSDIANLLESTQIATLFLDRSLVVKNFTPAATDLFHLVQNDVGRPIGHVRARFGADTVRDDAERVLRTVSTIERLVESTTGDARYVMRVLPYRTIDNVIAGVVVTFADITRVTLAEARVRELTHDLRNRVENLETLLDLLPVGVMVVEDRGSGQVRVNRHGAGLLGQDGQDTALRPVDTPWKLVADERELAPQEYPLQAAAATGTDAPDFEGHLERADGSSLDVMISATPLFDEHGKVRGAIAAIVDISERKAAEAHQQFLLNELQHRVKNTVSSIGALASRMLKTSTSLEDFAPAFQGRIKAIAGVHELLSHSDWVGVGLQPLVETTLRPLVGPNGSRLQIEGPAVTLTPEAASALGMVLYELGTNAAKYGALSGRRGRIHIAWRVDAPTERLYLDWIEHGGPAVAEPRKSGFGASFVTRCVDYELRGKADLQMRADGVRCSLDFPFRRNVQAAVGKPEDGSDHDVTR